MTIDFLFLHSGPNIKFIIIMRITKIIGLFLSITLLFITCGDDVEVENGLKDAPKLTFSKLTVNKQEVTKEQLLQQIKEKEKEGFSIKKITISDSAFAEVQGTAPNFSLKIKKSGTFKITLTLQKTGFKEVTIEATIVYVGTKLTFSKLTVNKQNVTKEQLLQQIKEKEKEGFSIKKITISDSAFAEVQGTAPNFSLKIKKSGTFKITLTLQKTGFKEVTIEATIVYVGTESLKQLVFKRWVISSKYVIKEADILKRIPEKDRAGYTLKALKGLREIKGGPGVAKISGLSIRINKPVGIFTVDLVLQHPNYLDTTITGATFEKKDHVYLFDEKTGTISGVMKKYITYFKTATEVTFPDQINGVDVLEIRGDGDDNVFSSGYRNNIKTIHLPQNLKTIGDSAFKNCSDLTSITLPDALTSIGENAFKNCSDLTSITLPDALTSIGENAFYGCNSLTSVTLPDALTSIEKDAFYGCNSLTSVTLPDALTSIGESAFGHCSSLMIITLPDKVTSIGENAFSGCNSLTSVTLPDALTSIGNGAFFNCSSLMSVTLPDALTSIGNGAFSSCSSLASITIPDKVTSIGDYAFYRCSKLIVTIEQTDPTKITLKGGYYSYAFSSVTQIKVPTASLATYKKAWSGWASKMVGY